jgi:hypothetical protein
MGKPRLVGCCLAVLVSLTAHVSAADVESTPHAARSRPSGQTLFTALPASETGIVAVNHYADPKMWGERYTELMNGSMGTGVAVADYDRDGRPDIYVISKTGPCRLFRNLGSWQFSDVSASAGLARSDIPDSTGRPDWTQGAAWADVDNDGWLDLYVCRYNAPNQLWMNQRDGTFKEDAAPRGLGIVDASSMAAFFDYDRDGSLDVYIHTSLLDATRAPSGQRDHLLRNRGDGTFEDVTQRAGISGETFAHAACVWDYDDDGWPDVYVANDFAAPDRLYRNGGDGTFRDVINQVVPHQPYSSMGVDLGDVDNDGRIDLLATDMAATNHEKDQRGMAYSRNLRHGPAEDSSTDAPQYSRNTLFLNTGTGRFMEAAALAGIAATDWTCSVRFEDFDNDGRLDLHVTNGMLREFQNNDLLTRLVLAQTPAERVAIMRQSPELRETNLAFRNEGELKFSEVGQAWGLNQHGISFGTAYGDFDGDGDLDAVVANFADSPTVLRNDAQTGHRVTLALRGTTSNRYGVGAKVELQTVKGSQLRHLVLARGYLSTSEPILHFGLGDAAVIDRLTIIWPSGHRQTLSAVAADQHYTITEPSGPPTQTQRASPPSPLFTEVSATTGLDFKSEENFELETQPLLPFRFDQSGPALALGDVDNDGKTDVVFGGTGRQPTQIMLQRDRYVASATLPPSRLDDGPILLIDADGDARVDLLRTKSGAFRAAGSPQYQPVLYRNTSDGFVAQPDALPALPMSVGAAAAADFNRDGRIDVFLGARLRPGRYPQPGRSVLLQNVGGRFEDVTDSIAPLLREPGLVRSALWSDVDADGWIDLLLALEWGQVRYYHNDAGRGFTDRTVSAGFSNAGTGWWTSLAAADFNQDGRLDYVVGNVGLNTAYQPPALLFLGSFKEGGTQLVEAHREGGTLLPRRTRKELGGQIPAILRRFDKNDVYARASLSDLLGADRLAAAQRFEATELQSGVFMSQPTGNYEFQPLPRIAQISPAQGMVAGDWDSDGHADLYLVQNSHAPNPGIGRFDGGLSQLLLGNGRGILKPVEAAQSGLVVPGDAKALASLDLNGDGSPDFLLTRNDGTVQAWQNNPLKGRHGLHVQLRAKSERATVVGSRVELELTDGTRQLAEVSAGGGHYSQAEPGVFFGWTDAAPPKALTIRWADGQTTSHSLDATVPAALTIEAPARIAP